MSLRITHLGSGSKGNATLLETEHVRVLVIRDSAAPRLNGDSSCLICIRKTWTRFW